MLLDSLNGGNMAQEQLDKAMFILTNKGPNTRLNRFLHLAQEKERKRHHFQAALVKEAERLGKLLPQPLATRLELLVLRAQAEGPVT